MAIITRQQHQQHQQHQQSPGNIILHHTIGNKNKTRHIPSTQEDFLSYSHVSVN